MEKDIVQQGKETIKNSPQRRWPLKKKIVIGCVGLIGLLLMVRVVERTVVNFPRQANFKENFEEKFNPAGNFQQYVLDDFGKPSLSNREQAQNSGNCPSIELLIDRLEGTDPSWDDIECNAQDLRRLPIPVFAKRVVADPNGVFDTHNNLSLLYSALWDKFAKEYSENLSSAVGHVLPPYADENRKTLSYPLSIHDHERVIKGRSVVFMAEKKKGRVIFFSNNPPPAKVAPLFKNLDEFEKWKSNTYVPQKTLEAKTAELIKAEYYDPFLVEAEVFFNKIDQPILGNLPDKELLTIAQDFVNDTRDAVRPYFKGRLIGRSYVKYEYAGDFWKNLSFKGFDEIMFTLVPTCDLASARSYITRQLSNYTFMAKRDNLPWTIGEFDVLEEHFKACGSNFEQLEEPLYQEMVAQIDRQTPGISGVHITLMASRISPSDKQRKIQRLINDYFLSR